MRIKTKLYLGLIFLFIVIIVIGVLGIVSLDKMANDSQAILKANYESLQYVKNMQQALDGIEIHDPASYQIFDKNLTAQEKNLTEAGEKDATADVRTRFGLLVKSDSTIALISSIRTSLYKIQELNMNAIVRKNDEAQHTADKAKMYLIFIGTFCFLISFSFIINFPRYIANPINDLTEGIKEIANKNYSQRLHFRSSDEFGELANAFNSMAERLDQYEHSNLAKILFEKKRIETIINNMKDPVIGFNEKNIVLFANEQAIKILNISESELLGKYGPDVALKNDLLRTLLNTNSTVKPLKIYADRKESYFLKEVYPIVSEEKSIGQVILLRNITHFQELDLAKTNFIATISHELKTPISSIKMSLQLLDDERIGMLNDEQKKLLANIRDDSQRLLKITGELLDLAQVETGNIKLEKQLVEPKAIIDYAYNALKFQAEQKQIVIEINYDPYLQKVNCDLEKTAWVMVNFLSNAIRYSPDKSKVIMEAKRENGSVIFSVKDSGRGIDPKYKDRVFEKFYQVPDSDTGKSGTGLGLAISKDFITAQGGKIWMESEMKEGSKFSFSLNTE